MGRTGAGHVLRRCAKAMPLVLASACALGACRDAEVEPPPSRSEFAESPVSPRRRADSAVGADASAGATSRAPAAELHVDIDALRRLGLAKGYEADDVAHDVVAAGEDAIPLLVDAFRSKDAAASRGAWLCLLLVPRPAVPALVPLLNDADDRTRRHAIDLLRQLENWWVTDASADAVVDGVVAGCALGGDDERRGRVALLLESGRRDDRVVAAARILLERTAPAESADVLGLVSDLGPAARSLAPLLLAWMDAAPKEDGEGVGGSLTWALAAVGPPDAAFVATFAERLNRAGGEQDILLVLRNWGDAAAPALAAVARLMSSEDACIRGAAIETLVCIPGGALPAVRAIVADRAAAAVRPDVKHEVRAVEDLGARAVEVLPWLEETLRTGSVEERAAAATALGHLPIEFAARARPLLLEAMESQEPRIRECAAWSLFWPPNERPPADAALERALADPHAEVRHVALSAMAWPFEGTHDTGVAEKVGAFLADPDPNVRFWAGNLLERIGAAPASALPAIRANLRSPERSVRLGALRAAKTLGLPAAPAVPDLLALVHGDLGGFALDAIAATGELDTAARDEIRAAASQNRDILGRALGAFGSRAGFLEDLGRQASLEGRPWSAFAKLTAAAASDRGEFAAWLVANRARLGSADYSDALRNLGVDGLPALLAWTTENGPEEVFELRDHVRALGPAAAAPLARVARDAPPAEAALAVEMLVEVSPADAAALLLEAPATSDASRRAAALRATRSAIRAGAAPDPFLGAAREGLRDVPDVRAAALDVFAASGRADADVLAFARAALRDPAPAVRVAAAGAVFAMSADVAAALPVLRAELNVPAPPYPAWGMIDHAPARPEDDYDTKERLWVAVARVLAAMGPAGAPAAEDLAWAALRLDDPGLQRRLVEAIEPMGPAAAPAARLVERLLGSDEPFETRFGDDSDLLPHTVARVLDALGVPLRRDEEREWRR